MPTANNGLTAASAASPAPPDDPVTGPVPEPHADHLTATVSPPPPGSPEDIRDREGLPPDAVILHPAPATLTRAPKRTWALLIEAVEITTAVDADGRAALHLLAGSWLADRAPAALCDGDCVLRITPGDDGIDDNVAVDIDLVFARLARWEILASWSRLGPTWPRVVAPTVAAVMGLYTDLVDVTARHDAARPFTSPLIPSAMNDLARLLDAGLVTAQEQFLWERDRGRIRHIARVRADGALALADGRVFATPSAAANTLSGYPRNGWDLFRRIGDGTTLGQLRHLLHQRHHARCSRS